MVGGNDWGKVERVNSLGNKKLRMGIGRNWGVGAGGGTGEVEVGKG